MFKWGMGTSTETPSSTLRMAMTYRQGLRASGLDPAKVDTIGKAHLIRMLYARLVEFSPDGQLQGSLAESFRVEGQRAIFKIRADAFSSTGSKIDAEDVAMSFRRLLVRNTNTHGRLGLFVCTPEPNLKSVNEHCDGIKAHGREVEFVLHPGVSPGFFIPMLASTDFSVIPKGAVDLTSPDAPIISYQETSGAYAVAKDDEVEFRHEFVLNAQGPQSRKGMAEKIVAVPVYGDAAAEALQRAEVDFIPTTSFLSSAAAERLKAELGSDVQIHSTLPIQLHAVMFTQRGLQELTSVQRIALGSKIKSRYLQEFTKEALRPTDQVFPALGEGELQPAEAQQVSKLYHEAASRPLPAGSYEIAVAPSDEEAFRRVLGADASPQGTVQVRVFQKAPWTVAIKEQPHAYVATQDSAFYEDISMVSYGLQHGFLWAANANAWIEKYISTDAKEARMDQLRELHLQSLLRGQVVPIGVASYRAAARAPWQMNFPQYFAGSPLWMLKRR